MQYHTDKVLNKLYSQFAKLYEKDPESDKFWAMLDKIADRRLELGEITEEELNA